MLSIAQLIDTMLTSLTLAVLAAVLPSADALVREDGVVRYNSAIGFLFSYDLCENADMVYRADFLR